MQSTFWKRASGSALAGAVALVLGSPLSAWATAAEDLPRLLPPGEASQQLGPLQTCYALSSGMLGGGTQQSGLGQLYSLGASGFYSPYYNPAYGSNGVGTAGGFLNYTGGQPSSLIGQNYSSLCGASMASRMGSGPGGFFLRDFYLPSGRSTGMVGSSFGGFGSPGLGFVSAPLGSLGFGGGFFGR